MIDAPVPSLINGGQVPESSRGNPWFDDGNVILFSGNIAFKVYKGMLSRHSTVFADLFATPQPNTDGEIMEGCPVVRLHDCAADLANFLTVIHDGYGKPFPLASKRDFAILSGVLRLATKYEAGMLRRHALLPFQRIYPSTLPLWIDALEGTSFIWFFDPVLVINLAREVSALSLLPAAMAYLANNTSAREAFGVSVSEVFPLRFSPGLANAEDLKGFALMKEYEHKSIAKILRLVRETVKGHHPTCQRSRGCRTRFGNMLVALSQLLYLAETPTGYPNFVFAVQRVLKTEDICGSCREGFEAGMVKERQAWWNGLPGALGFSGWEDSRLDVQSEHFSDMR